MNTFHAYLEAIGNEPVTEGMFSIKNGEFYKMAHKKRTNELYTDDDTLIAKVETILDLIRQRHDEKYKLYGNYDYLQIIVQGSPANNSNNIIIFANKTNTDQSEDADPVSAEDHYAMRGTTKTIQTNLNPSEIARIFKKSKKINSMMHMAKVGSNGFRFYCNMNEWKLGK